MDTADRPNVQDGDTVRPMTDAELAQWEADVEEARQRREQAQAAEAAAAAARESARAKLAALGLTPEEIAALSQGGNP